MSSVRSLQRTGHGSGARDDEGGHELGRGNVASYWKRQWARIDPHVVPTNFTNGPDGESIVEVQQTVHDLHGELLSQKLVCHVFRFENGLIKRFDIREPPCP